MIVSAPTSRRKKPKRNFFDTAKAVLTNPKEFFAEEREKKHHWKELLMYLGIFSILASVFLTPKRAQQIENLLLKQPLPFDVSLNLTVGAAIAFFIGNIILLVLLTSMKYWIAHWFVRMYNPKATLKKTYAQLTYGGTPGWLAIPFFIVGWAMLFLAIEQRHFIFWFGAIICLIVWLCLEGYSIFMRVYALAHVQKITKTQAFLSAYVWGLLSYLVILGIIELILITVILLIFVATGVIDPAALAAYGT